MTNFRIKRDNYLLRSTRSAQLILIMALACGDRIRTSGHGMPCVVDAFGRWSSDCSWEVNQLVRKGFLKQTTTALHTYFEPTEVGHDALYAARMVRKVALDETLRTGGLVISA